MPLRPPIPAAGYTSILFIYEAFADGICQRLALMRLHLQRRHCSIACPPALTITIQQKYQITAKRPSWIWRLAWLPTLKTFACFWTSTALDSVEIERGRTGRASNLKTLL